MNMFWFLLSAVAVPFVFAAATLIPAWRRKRIKAEWDAWAKREAAKRKADAWADNNDKRGIR